MDKIYRSASARDQDKEEQMLCVSGDASLAGWEGFINLQYPLKPSSW